MTELHVRPLEAQLLSSQLFIADHDERIEC